MLGFAYYAISPLFNTVEVNDELPEDIILPTDDGATTEEEVDTDAQEEDLMPSGVEELSEERQEELKEAMDKASEEEVVDMDDSMPEDVVEETEAPTEPQVTIESFPVMQTLGHPASGQVKVLNTTSGQIIRYEDFSTINGPNLHIYLAKDLDAEEFIDLGPIKGTQGNINYEVPEGTDLSEYRYVMHWCVPFGVLFNYAEIL